MATAEHTDDDAVSEDVPSSAEVQAQLERVLGSVQFASAGRGSEFLRYVVDETLAGRGERLKGYTIAVDVFGKTSEFNASADPLVRVEARRVRRRLVEYYESAGRDDPLRIELPVGGYVARFTRAATARTGEPPAAPVPARRRGRIGLGAALAATILIVVVAGILDGADPGAGAPAGAPASTVAARTNAGPVPPSVAVAGFVNLSGNVALDDFVAGLTEETIVRLSESGVPVSLEPRPAGHRQPAGRVPAVELPAVGYVLTGGVRQEGGMIRISPRLVDVASGAQVWAASLDEHMHAGEQLSTQERIGKRIASILANPLGPMYAHEIAKIADVPTEQLDSYGCVLQFRAFAKSLEREAHRRSKECFLRAVAEAPQPAQIWAGLALVYQHEYWHGYNAEGPPADALQRAREAAINALHADGENVLAALAMTSVRYSAGELDAFAMMADRALALSGNPGTEAQIGLLMTLAGEPQRGLELLDHAFAAAPEVADWYNIGYSFNALLSGDYDQAIEWAWQTDSPGWFAAPMAAAAAAGLAGRKDIAARSIEQLLAVEPDFPATGGARLTRWIRDPQLVNLLVEGLRAAGLELCAPCPDGD